MAQEIDDSSKPERVYIENNLSGGFSNAGLITAGDDGVQIDENMTGNFINSGTVRNAGTATVYLRPSSVVGNKATYEETSCGALLLDIEGYEYHALRGAVETIRRCRPVIQLELKGIGDQYGMPESETDVWLCSGLGYRREAKLANDRLYVPV
jgi:hypothetical protein